MEIEQIKDMALKAMLVNGQQQPMIIVEGEKLGATITPQTLPQDGREKQILFMSIGHKVAGDIDQMGKAKKVYFISEAWYTKASKGKTPTKPIRTMKNKREALVISSLDMQTQKQRLFMYEIKRNRKGSVKTLIDKSGKNTKVESSLLDAFQYGYNLTLAMKQGQDIEDIINKASHSVN